MQTQTPTVEPQPWDLTIPWNKGDADSQELLLGREWLVTNGTGGYASGTLCGVVTRRYHGFLVAALPAPLGRIVMLTQVSEELRIPGGRVVRLAGQEYPGDPLNLDWVDTLAEFRLESGLPVWRYEISDFVLEKRIVLPYRQNTVYLTYRLLRGSGELRLRLRPFMHFRQHEQALDRPLEDHYRVTALGSQVEIEAPSVASSANCGDTYPPLRMLPATEAGALVLDGGHFRDIFYRLEFRRGYEARGTVWSPGYFRFNLAEGETAGLVASTEEWETLLALTPQEAWDAEIERRRRLLEMAAPEARRGPASQLVLGADQFIVSPITRAGDVARALASGDEFRTVIAGYHWFTDWGRDTMISLEGLTLVTGRTSEAGYILRTFAHYIQDGLIPNMFPEGEREGLYHTADATLWFFHSLNRYLQYSNDRATLTLLLPKLIDIFDHHVAGTRFGIRVDPADGLLTQGAEGYQLTWMDAKVADWVVTPRRGKAVEINALWYNALRLLEKWVKEERGEGEAGRIVEHAEKVRESFNRRFWYEQGQYLYDVVDGENGDDRSFRPNQVLAISLDHPVLDRRYWSPVLEAVANRLLTPVGLRSLAPDEPHYKARYDGDLRSRDAAYHQGTVWAWLIGPFVDAWLRLNPEEYSKAYGFLEGLIPHLQDAGVGTVSEIFDAEEPFTPRGCIAQAWSVAELLRCLVKTSR
ncbi:MAG TPA: amylo-alpha-1,6-glucosidase [Acidobacteriota bacterium]|nr:amylo-alpha-1,6-glucosidase [Acidobacteriota bacterium]